MAHESVIWVLSMALIPALLLLLVLMERLEQHAQRKMAADEIWTAFHAYDSPDELEALIGRTAEPLLRQPAR